MSYEVKNEFGHRQTQHVNSYNEAYLEDSGGRCAVGGGGGRARYGAGV